MKTVTVKDSRALRSAIGQIFGHSIETSDFIFELLCFYVDWIDFESGALYMFLLVTLLTALAAVSA